MSSDDFIKARIKVFIDDVVYPNYDGVDENDLATILLEFYNFLKEHEARRMQE